MGLNMPDFLRNIFYPDGVTPLPWRSVCILSAICITHNMELTMVFSFAPKMVKTFGVSEVDVGYFAGLLASAMYLGFVFCIIWSHLADNKGKKFALITSTSVMAVAILAFGFSYNYRWALVTRFLQGCSFGANSVSKSYLNEKLDDTNRSLGMSVLLSCGTAGLLIGPSLAGFLVFPTEQYPNVFPNNSLFHIFPILLPNILVFVAFCAVILLATFYLPSHKENKPDDQRKDKPDEYTPLLQKRADDNIKHSMSDHSILCADNIEVDESRENPQANHMEIRCVASRWNKLSNTKIVQLFKMKNCILSCSLYGMYGFVSIAADELLPLLASTSLQYNGMAFTTSEIGTVLMIASICLVIVQIPLIAKVTNFFGARKAFIYSVLLQAVLIPLLPAVGLIVDKKILWPVLCMHTFCSRLFVSASFVTVTVLINNSVGEYLNATANGLGFTFTAIGRLISPSIFGLIYSWSLTNIKGVESNKTALGFPFDQFFPFFVLAICATILAIIATRAPKSLDVKLVEKVNITGSDN